jgi:diaminohydroxyphosphoribosylaminopyrimidine deaminase/5-amino-6-(5-phosphoribosylamino)uracil reductase
LSLQSNDGHGDAPSDAAWRRVLAARGTGTLGGGVGARSRALFGPLLAAPGERLAIGQLGQSLDGRIATSTGHSHYVNGRPAIVHLHRLRALVDAVVVGVGTVVADDPALTVRHVEGDSPARVVVDPRGRMPAAARLLADDGRRRLVVMRPGVASTLPHGVERIELAPGADGRIPPAAIVDALAARGLPRLLVEGGAATVSAFVEARALHRLHVAVAPLLIGSGPTGLVLPPIDRLDDALRPRARCYALGEDVLWDLELASAGGTANRST